MHPDFSVANLEKKCANYASKYGSPLFCVYNNLNSFTVHAYNYSLSDCPISADSVPAVSVISSLPQK
jgi:hypothetical protein